jgi:hypothetical protein
MPTRTNVTPSVVGAITGIFLATLILLVFGLGQGSHRDAGWVTQARTVAAFDRLEVAAAARVTVTVGDARDVRVRAPADIARAITTRVTGGSLRITGPPNTRSQDTPTITVRVPSLRALTFSGSGLLIATGIRTGDLAVSLPGTGLVRAGGTTTRLVATLDGTGDLQLDGLAARDVRATLGGTGRITLVASERLDASLAGTGEIAYGGHPAHVRTAVSGTGAIVRR